MFLLKIVAVIKTRGLAFLRQTLIRLGVDVPEQALSLGSFLSQEPLPALIPKPKPKNDAHDYATGACSNWLTHTAEFPLEKSKIPDLVSLCYPDVNRDQLLAALVNITGLFIYDDYIDRGAADLATKSLSRDQAGMRTVFSNPDVYHAKPESEKTGFLKMMFEMGDYLRKALPAENSLTEVYTAFSGYLDAMVEETGIRRSFAEAYSTGNMDAVLSTDERHFLRLRNRSSGVEFVFSLCAVFESFSLGGARSNHRVDTAILSCGDAIGVFNDIVTLRKDLVEGLTENLVLILAEKAFLSNNSVLADLSLDQLKSSLFYRDLCVVKSLDEDQALLQKAVKAIEAKYGMLLSPESLEILLNGELDSFLSVAGKVGKESNIDFKGNIFEPWVDVLRSSIQETTHKYFNQEVVAFYQSINACKEEAEVTPDRFPPELFRYFNHLEDWLSGSSHWTIDPENKRYNWWRTT